jgi:predicted MPP superfamily phosphohydrolase
VTVTRRKFLQTGAAAVATGAVAVGADSTLFEPLQPKLVKVEVPLSRLPTALDGLTIAQLSDFHYDDYLGKIPIRRAVEMVNQLQPHLVVLTGDFVTISVLSSYLHNAKQAADVIEPCAGLLSLMRSPLGVFTVLGNHDSDSDPERIVETLHAHGITALRNRSIPLQPNGGRMWLAGVEDVLVGKPDLDVTLRRIPRSEPVVLLAHEPDFADEVARRPVDLQLSGHSHGGQIRFPLIGALYYPELARKYPRGLRQVGPLTLYTNVGLGTIRIPARLDCPPEVTLFTLRTASRKQ